MKYANHELVALDTFLAYYPKNLSYAEIIDTLKDGDCSNFDIVGDFEDLDYDHIAQLISGLHDDLIDVYGR